MAAVGVRVDRIAFSLSYSQSDYATFEGRVNVSMWMEHQKYDTDRTYAEAFPALFVAVEQDGSYALVNAFRRTRPYIDYQSYTEHTVPDGLFQHLDEQAWDDLIGAQEQEATLEDSVSNWVRAQCEALYVDLRKEYESISDENSFIDACEANEVMFEIEEEEDEVCS